MNNTKKAPSIRVFSAITMFLTMAITFSFMSLTVKAEDNRLVYVTCPGSKYYTIYYVCYPVVCKSNENPMIPDAYKKLAVVNLFENLWSQMEDGSDWIGSAGFMNSDKEFNDILAYLNGLSLTKTNDFAPNFTPDFSFTNGKEGENGYDFVFLADQLVMRDPAGNCYIVNISQNRYNDLKNYIEKIRSVNSEEPIVGAYSKDRAVADEDLIVFNEALEGLEGVSYEPTLVATQVVAGMNYRFTAIATPVVPDAESKSVYIYIFKPLQGAAELVKIEDI